MRSRRLAFIFRDFLQGLVSFASAPAPAPSPAPSPSPAPAPSGVLWSTLGVQAGDSPTIGPGTTVLMDVPNPPPLGTLTISPTATLRNYGDSPVALTVDSIENSGSLIFESANGTPYLGQLDITLTGAPVPGRIVGHNAGVSANDNGGANRALMMMDGSVTRLRGAYAGAEHRAKLQATGSALGFAAGTRTLTLDRSVAWKAGKRIAIGPTGFTPTGSPNRTEIFTLAADTVGNTIQLQESAGLGFFRFARLQYPTDASANVSQVINGYTIQGLSLTRGPQTTKPSADTPDVLDHRASVMLLDRNITIKGANDSRWATERFGGHCMTHGITSENFIDGVLFERMGQGGTLGRYGGWHWHMPSYDPATGANLGDYGPNKAVWQNNAVYNSANRACVLHGVRGAVVRNNSAVGVFGHAFFLEDGSEQNNTVDGNWAYLVSDPGSVYRTKFHDERAAGFWITNAGNNILNNVAGDCVRGVWYAPNGCDPYHSPNGDNAHLSNQLGSDYVGGCFGLSKKVDIFPMLTAPNNNGFVWDNNAGHSCQEMGPLSNDFACDEDGNTAQGIDTPTVDGRPGSERMLPTFKGTRTWKNMAGGYSNRMDTVHYTGWTTSDNLGDTFFGQVTQENGSYSENHLMVGRSLNAEPPPAGYPEFYSGFATYHGALKFRYIWGFNFNDNVPVIFQGNLRKSSMSEAWDLYLRPTERYFAECAGWVLVNTLAMYRTPPPYLWPINYSTWISGGPGLARNDGSIIWGNYNLAGALYDHFGTLAGDPALAGGFVIFDTPYSTYGLTTTPVQPTATSQTVSTMAPVYGVRVLGDDNEYQPYTFSSQHLVMQQVGKTNNTPVSGAVLDVPSEWGADDDNGTVASSGALLSSYSINEYPHGYPAGTKGRNAGNPGPFHHGTIARGQRVLITLPNRQGRPNSVRWSADIYDLRRTVAGGAPQDDIIEFIVEWSGAVPPKIRTSWRGTDAGADYYVPNYGLNLTPASGPSKESASLAAFNASTGSAFWRDTANNNLLIRLNAADIWTIPATPQDLTVMHFQVSAT